MADKGRIAKAVEKVKAKVDYTKESARMSEEELRLILREHPELRRR